MNARRTDARAIYPDPRAAEVNDVGARVLSELLRRAPVGNVVISPLSLVVALQMAADGARGKTEATFRRALGLGAEEMPYVSSMLSSLSQLLSSDEARSFTMANGIWAAPAAGLNESYSTALRASFAAEVASLDFTKPEAPAVINRWVAERTAGLIPDLLGELSPETRLVLVNALAFKGRWERSFDPERTRPQRFAVAGAGASDVPMMHTEPGQFRYRETDAFQAVLLPFVAGRFEAVILLPTRLDAVDWAKAQGADGWREALARPQFGWREGDLALPRLDVTLSPEVRAAVERLGLAEAFARDADFSGMASGPLWLSGIIHRTVLKLAEEGVEAAAATALPMVGASPNYRPPPPFHLVADRPFVFVLRHAQTGAIILMGVINDPRGPA